MAKAVDGQSQRLQVCAAVLRAERRKRNRNVLSARVTHGAVIYGYRQQYVSIWMWRTLACDLGHVFAHRRALELEGSDLRGIGLNRRCGDTVLVGKN